jgi:hypothetical protein
MNERGGRSDVAEACDRGPVLLRQRQLPHRGAYLVPTSPDSVRRWRACVRGGWCQRVDHPLLQRQQIRVDRGLEMTPGNDVTPPAIHNTAQHSTAQPHQSQGRLPQKVQPRSGGLRRGRGDFQRTHSCQDVVEEAVDASPRLLHLRDTDRGLQLPGPSRAGPRAVDA